MRITKSIDDGIKPSGPVEEPDTRALPRVVKDIAGANPILLGAIAADGVREITYSFRADPGKIPLRPGTINPTNLWLSANPVEGMLNARIIKAQLHNFRQDEKLFNVRYVPAKDQDKADIRIFVADWPDDPETKDVAGYTNRNNTKQPFILYNRKKLNECDAEGNLVIGDERLRHITSHEKNHCLGLNHPDGEHGLKKGSADKDSDGYNEAYTQRLTVQSYNGAGTREMSSGDVYAGQQIGYGTPRDDGKSHIIDWQRLKGAEQNVLWAARSLEMDLSRDKQLRGVVVVNLAKSTNFNGGISGERESVFTPLWVQIAHGVTVKSVSVANTDINLNATGAAGIVLNGGDQWDILTMHGGDNTLTGGKGEDRFVITPESGSGNIITDFSIRSMRDSLESASAFDKVELRYIDHYMHNKTAMKGTEATFIYKNGQHETRSTVFLKDASPQRVAKSISAFGIEDLRAPIKELIEIRQDAPEQRAPAKEAKENKKNGQGTRGSVKNFFRLLNKIGLGNNLFNFMDKMGLTKETPTPPPDAVEPMPPRNELSPARDAATLQSALDKGFTPKASLATPLPAPINLPIMASAIFARR